MGAMLLQLAPFLIPQALAIIKAIAALRQAGVSEEQIAALVAAISANVKDLTADTLATLEAIPLPKPPAPPPLPAT